MVEGLVNIRGVVEGVSEGDLLGLDNGETCILVLLSPTYGKVYFCFYYYSHRYAMSENSSEHDQNSGNEVDDDGKVEIVVKVMLRQRNKERVVGEANVAVDKDVLSHSPVNVTMNLCGSPATSRE